MSDVEVGAARTSEPSGLSREQREKILSAWVAEDPAAPATVRAFLDLCLERASAAPDQSPPELAQLDPQELTCAARGLVTLLVAVRELASRAGDGQRAHRAAAWLDRVHAAVLDRLATEREELLRRHRAAAEALAVHERVLSVMAHDLRSPLAAIDLVGAVLLEMPATGGDPFVRKQAELIRRNAGRMSRLIGELIDSAAIHAGRLALERRRCSLSALVSEVLEAHRPMASDKEITLRADVRLGDRVVRCDRERVHQALSQLLGHAIELGERGAEVTLEAEVCGAEARVSVAGPGIPEPERPHVFELFRGGRERRSKGFGLFIARGVIEAHGGSIGVEHDERQGSTLWFTLPLAEWDESDAEP